MNLNPVDYAKRIARIIATPVAFTSRNGHWRSAWQSKAVGPDGLPVPMYTYPINDLFFARDWSNSRILEWGSGQSTLWWSKKAKKIVSIESYGPWAQYVETQLEDPEKVNLIHGLSFEDTVEKIQAMDTSFDVIVVDAEPRVNAASISPQFLAEGGIIVVDNSDLTKFQEIPANLSKEGFNRVDFYGYSPGAYHKQCTSIYFKSSKFWNYNEPVVPLSPRSHTG